MDTYEENADILELNVYVGNVQRRSKLEENEMSSVASKDRLCLLEFNRTFMLT